MFKKIAKNKGKDIKKHGDAEAVLKDMQSDLNLPIVVNYKNGEFEVVNKTIMRKKGFKTTRQRSSTRVHKIQTSKIVRVPNQHDTTKDLAKSTKAKRDAYFKKHGKKADDDSSAYKPVPQR